MSKRERIAKKRAKRESEYMRRLFRGHGFRSNRGPFAPLTKRTIQVVIDKMRERYKPITSKTDLNRLRIGSPGFTALPQPGVRWEP